MQNQTSPLILTFGAADPVGAIGVTADMAVFSSLGCHGLAVTTALLIGDSAGVEDMQEVDPDWVADQARVLLEDAHVSAFKIGALENLEHASAIAEIVSDYPDAPLVLDPFSSRLPSQGEDAEELLTIVRQLLVPQTSVLVLSQVELGRLAETWREDAAAGPAGGTGDPAADGDPDDGDEAGPEDEEDLCEAPAEGDTMADDVRHLIELGCEFVLVTGTPASPGHSDGARANTLFGADGVVRHDCWLHLPGPFLGAGGTLSAAIAAYLAQGADTPSAVQLAMDYTQGALAHAQRYGMGKLVPNRHHRMLATLLS
ncbi:bifunctional hydroxymethylpyrimidine kinase/phosphomethylpyrimidine kinase [Pseudoduganella namucuonensis]|uniref:hydroxymethylpyrimidine kinase n=1 Tax=Pseudoduganella namucuonensis TaxID=1035707 RepID=A0A1I7LJ16_9BURK|nr:hydroxymethylpyrimidine/phosphomethylpyrimidine kinase [Pseudoduganella namucuonensis]SFV09686.1 hydroxymethylpyrimidine/phosphomethylpyrimidine kinase [Pseudoduganella namucuonensis]